MWSAFRDWSYAITPSESLFSSTFLFNCLGQSSTEEHVLAGKSITEVFCDSSVLVPFSGFVLPYRSSALGSLSLEEEYIKQNHVFPNN